MNLKKEIQKLEDIVATRLPLKHKEKVYKEVSENLSKLVSKKSKSWFRRRK